MANHLDKPRNIMIKNVTIQFPKLKNHTHYAGSDQYELGMITEDPDVAKGWVDLMLPTVKPNDAMKPTAWTCGLRRKVLTSKGEENGRVRVVDADKRPLENAELGQIGNGTVANLIVFQSPYDNEFGKGVTNSLTAVQITHLEKYEGGIDDIDFDIEGDGAEVEGVDSAEIF